MNTTIEPLQLQVSAMTFGPYASARIGGENVLIPAAVPGDTLEIELRQRKTHPPLGCILRVIHPAPERRQPPCPYAAGCGGCDWQHIRYDAQIGFKTDLLTAEFRKLGVELDSHGLVEPAPAELGYRSRVRLKTGPAGTIGFYRPGSHSLFPIDACLVAAPPILTASRLSRALGPLCPDIEVVAGPRGEVLIAHLTKAPGTLERQLARRLVDGGAAGLILRGGARREVFGDARIDCEAEPGCVIEADADLFSQVNRAQNLKLVAAVMQMAGISHGTRVLDLFCGTGNFSLPAARRAASVLGLDRDGLAIAAARANAVRMALPQTQFVAMHAAAGLQFLLRTGYRPDLLIMDPPRAGAAYLLASIARLKPPSVLYVSCNPSTLMRDLRQLVLHGYQVGRVSAFDFFPNTHHLEIVTSLLLT